MGISLGSTHPSPRGYPINVIGVLVYARPGQAEQARASLLKIPGVEIHALTPGGRLVVTVEKDDDLEMAGIFDLFNQVPEIASTVLVYNHFEDLDSDSESQSLEESKP